MTHILLLVALGLHPEIIDRSRKYLHSQSLFQIRQWLYSPRVHPSAFLHHISDIERATYAFDETTLEEDGTYILKSAKEECIYSLEIWDIDERPGAMYAGAKPPETAKSVPKPVKRSSKPTSLDATG